MRASDVKIPLKILLIVLPCMLFWFLTTDYHKYILETRSDNKVNKFSREEVQQIKSAQGMVDIKEIVANVWEPFGYSLVSASSSHSQLIPVLKKKDPAICEKVFDDWVKISDKGLTKDPPVNLEPRDKFALNGYAKILPCYMKDVFNNDDSAVKNADEKWSKATIERWLADGRAGNFKFMNYHDSMSIYHATKYHNIVGKVGAVIGSLSPWVEVVSLLNGAKQVFTVDYQKANIGHPNVSFIHALDLVKGRDIYMDDFDFVVSYSSIEHSGLGRYGDPIDPIGDLREMEKVRCILKPGGLFFFSVPVGFDTTGFNCHRYYGRIRLAMMFAGFELISAFKNDEGKPHDITLEDLYKELLPHEAPHVVFVLRKPKG